MFINKGIIMFMMHIRSSWSEGVDIRPPVLKPCKDDGIPFGRLLYAPSHPQRDQVPRPVLFQPGKIGIDKVYFIIPLNCRKK